ncbi:MAG: hypothetical protein JO138_22580 [Acidobacteriaceae bacterium]|nr:hypothetical protein [Acidobacteriaceae bacterium]
MTGRTGPSVPDRSRFVGYAARVMRGFVIDHLRNRQAPKRGGLRQQVSPYLDQALALPDEERAALLEGFRHYDTRTAQQLASAGTGPQ